MKKALILATLTTFSILGHSENSSFFLSSEKIVQEKELKLQGKALWSPAEVEAIEKQFDKSLSALLSNFPPGQLYLHPVKLSKWNNDL